MPEQENGPVIPRGNDDEGFAVAPDDQAVAVAPAQPATADASSAATATASATVAKKDADTADTDEEKMEITYIDPMVIDWPPIKGDERTYSDEFAKKLAGDMRVEGMQNPIMVYPNREKPGRYIGVAGRHRHGAASQYLGWKTVPCYVRFDFDDEQADMARIAENLFRNPLNKAQHMASLAKWQAHYAKIGTQKRGEAGRQARLAQLAQRKAEQGLAPGQTLDRQVGGSETPAVAQPVSFSQTVADTTGVSKRTAERAVKIASSFTDEQFKVFAERGVSQEMMEKLSKFPEEFRAGAVTLIASGMLPEDALDATQKIVANAKTTDTGKAGGRKKPKSAEDLTDDEWLAKFCGDIRGKLANTEIFDRDAIFFRKFNPTMNSFRTPARRRTGQMKELTPFALMVARLAWTTHPKDWLVCATCKGSGKQKENAKENCTDCRNGAGYKVRVDNKQP